MIKRMISFLIIAVLMISMLVGCGNAEKDANGKDLEKITFVPRTDLRCAGNGKGTFSGRKAGKQERGSVHASPGNP